METTPEEGSETGEVTVVGTVHVTQESVDRVNQVITEEDPDVIAVELGYPRFEEHMEQRNSEDTENNLPSFLDAFRNPQISMRRYIILRGLWEVQTRMARAMDMENENKDMQEAVELSIDTEKPLALIDRSRDETFNRLTDQLSITEFIKMGGGIIVALGSMVFTDTAEKQVQKHEKSDSKLISEVMEKVKHHVPSFHEVFIKERNIYLADALQKLQSEGHNTVAIVGKGHEEAIKEYLADSDELETAKQSSGISGNAILIDWENQNL